MLKRCLAWLVVLVGCGTDPADLGPGEGPSVTRDGGSALESCEPGKALTCYCPDGKRSGSQRCSDEGRLSACACDGEMSVGAAPMPAPGGALCAELANNASCEAVPYVSKELPTSMLFVLDRSRSMACNLPPLQSSEACEQTPEPVDPDKPTKWQITKGALARTFDQLPAANALLGLSFLSNNGDCGVDSTPAVGLDPLDGAQRSELKSALDTVTPDGLTPIVGATILAYHHLHQEKKAPGNRYVVLITDGAESCAPESVTRLLEDEVKKAREANIRTFVIGAPGSEPARALLSELAYRGGTARSSSCKHDPDGPADQGDCHLDMTKSSDFAGALAEALGTVSNAAQSCEFAVPPFGDPNDVNVQYTGKSGKPVCFAPLEEQACNASANGWQFARNGDGTEDKSRVVLCGQACETIRKDPAARVDVLIGCEPYIYI